MYGAIFDMDGVLFPTEELKFKAYEQVFKEAYGLVLADTVERLGISETDATRLFLKLNSLPADEFVIRDLIKKKRQAYLRILGEEEFAPYPGVKNFLRALQVNGQFKLALATSSEPESTEILLARFGLKFFFAIIVTAKDVIKAKPDPQIYLLAAKMLALNPDRCVVFEDSPAGIASAKSANMKCVAITTGVSAKLLLQADLITGSFKRIDEVKINELF
jgi:beta-phosphoglucomutase